jgi:exodeoxyribonuclease VII large subunit
MTEAGVRDPIPRILTVSALNQIIRFRLEEDFPEVWVEGEISNLRIPSSGHSYFTLKDEACQVRAVIFRSTGARLKFTPEDGLHVLCRARLTVYEPRGEYQLLVERMEPRGIGALQLAFEQLKEKLRKEGLFDPARKRPLPSIPKRIGVVTSPTGAAIRDILKVLRGRFADVSVLINPVPVQGEGAAVAIAGAIRELNERGDSDVLIVGRGGGSLEDLWAFNEEVVARAIADSAIPVISAVGHEIDTTISDWVADVRAPTPSAAAEMVIRRKSDLIRQLDTLGDRLASAVRAALNFHRASLRFQTAALKDPRRAIQAYFLRLDELESRIRRGIHLTLRTRRDNHRHLMALLQFQNPADRLERLRVELDHGLVRLRQGLEGMVKNKRASLEAYSGRLNSLSPLAVLERGYSLTYRLPGMQLVKEAREVAAGDRVQVRLRRGTLTCDVSTVKENENGPAEV